MSGKMRQIYFRFMYVIDYQYGFKFTTIRTMRISYIVKYSIYGGFFKEITRQKEGKCVFY